MPQFLTINQIERDPSLTKIPNSIDTMDAVKMLQEVGYVAERTKNHYILKKDGEASLTLFSTGRLTNWLTQAVYKAHARALRQIEEQEMSPDDYLPLTVIYEDELWAVQGQFGDDYRIQSLVDGHTKRVKISDTEFPSAEVTEVLVEVQELQNEDPQEDNKVEDSSQAALPPPPSIDQVLSNPSDAEAWIRLTRRYIDGLSVKIKQVEGQLEGMRTQRDVFQQVLDYVTQGKAITQLEPKRTVLPPRMGGGPKPLTTPKEEEKIIEMWNDKRSAKAIAEALGWPDHHRVYTQVQRLRRAERLAPGR